MDFNYSDPIPLVQKKKKYASFKLTMIGGPDEINKWRQMQEAKENTLKLRLIDRDSRITRYEIEMNEKLDEPGLKKEEWRDKVSRVLTERKETAERVKQALEYQPWQVPIIKDKTKLERFTTWLAGLWHNVNL